MPAVHPYLTALLTAVNFEEKEQVKRFSLDQAQSLKLLKAEGLALHPLTITRKNFGYADYPEITFRLAFPAETIYFKDGAAIECFCEGNEPVKGVLLNLEGKTGEFRLFAPDFPDWIEENNVGIKLAPDQRTTAIMKTVLNNIPNDKRLANLFELLHSPVTHHNPVFPHTKEIAGFNNSHLNESQKKAVASILSNDNIAIVHGPPGTGKTTTLVEAIIQLIKTGEKVLVAAPGNAAVDHLAKSLVAKNVKILRVGNTSKVDEMVFMHTPEGKISGSKQQKEIRQLKLRAEEFRRMALKYKRSFGKAEREQRQLLFKEVKNLRNEIKALRTYNESKLFEEADVIIGTPIGIYDSVAHNLHFKTLIIDEAGQCIEPLAWCLIPFAEKMVLAGDHWQLPPTVISQEAANLGLNNSILEIAIAQAHQVTLLDTQYRMRAAIAGFSGEYFYKGLLKTAKHLNNSGTHLTFIDTAGSGNFEKPGRDGLSLENLAELRIVQLLMENEPMDLDKTAFISPYSAQITAAGEMLPAEMRKSTIDSFQGQEQDNIIVSLVRSNDDGEIGFLKDYRRMNVAITRAREQLVIIGDSATIGADKFYLSLLEYIEKHGSYRTIWEFDV